MIVRNIEPHFEALNLFKLITYSEAQYLLPQDFSPLHLRILPQSHRCLQALFCACH